LSALSALALMAGVALAVVGVLSLRTASRLRAPLSPIQQATRKSLTVQLELVRRRWEELVRLNEQLAREVARLGEQRDRARDELFLLKDELSQRLARCTCGVGAAVAADLDKGKI
jgi:hypothetical protein